MLPTLEAPELVFGICSPIGTNNSAFTKILASSLKKYGYHPEYFKVTQLMRSVLLSEPKLIPKPVEEKYDSRIRYANTLRGLFESPSVLSMMCCAAVRAYRRKSSKSSATAYLPSHAYIFDQFKRREEIEALRQVYGKAFVLVSIYSDKGKRIQSLAEQIASDHAVPRPTDENDGQARQLARRDEDEEGEPTGQRLRDTFPHADLFVNSDNVEEMEQLTDRFLALLFGANNLSPTREEYGMYTARSAALRSLDLSRQVGAAIFTPNSEVIAIGCNEVPKAGGGTYWARDDEDARDYTLKHDENDRMRRVLLADVVRRLMDAKLLPAQSADEIVNRVIAEAGKTGSTLRDALLMDLLEFGRIVHAEMCALSDAARLGRAVKDGTLYSTAFPCHLCAKHIVAAGIKRVVFIEPYPKSYAEDLHKDSIIVSANKHDGSKVQFSPFIGVAPRRYQELFERGRRKDSAGRYIEWQSGSPRPLVRYTVATYLVNEEAFVKMFETKLRELEQKGAVSVAK